MAKRYKMGNQQSQRHFSRNARPHPKNVPRGLPMRGGIRL